MAALPRHTLDLIEDLIALSAQSPTPFAGRLVIFSRLRIMLQPQSPKRVFPYLLGKKKQKKNIGGVRVKPYYLMMIKAQT
jgi:hypothetical protein